MTELNEQISKELDDMVKSLEYGKELFRDKFKDLFEEFVRESYENFYSIIEGDTRYNFDRWIRETCDDIIMGLLSGDTQWLKQKAIISEYSWDKIQKIRLAIWEAAGGEIANSTIHALQKEVEELKKDNKQYREELHRSY